MALAFYSKVGFIIFLSVGVAIMFLMIPLMMPYVATVMRTRRILSTVSYRSLCRHIAKDDAEYVGEAWSFWLNYSRPTTRPVVISMSRSHSGIVKWHDHAVCVRSGTRLCDLQTSLSQKGKTFVDRSQFDDMTVGGALKTGAHGFNAYCWMIETVLSARIAYKGSHVIETINASDVNFRRLLLATETVILNVTMQTMDDRISTLVNREWINTDDIDLTAYAKSKYRMIFIRKNFINAKWLDDDKSSYMQQVPLRVEYVRQQFMRIRRNFEVSVSISKAQAFVSDLDAVEALSFPY